MGFCLPHELLILCPPATRSGLSTKTLSPQHKGAGANGVSNQCPQQVLAGLESISSYQGLMALISTRLISPVEQGFNQKQKDTGESHQILSLGHTACSHHLLPGKGLLAGHRAAGRRNRGGRGRVCAPGQPVSQVTGLVL